MSDQDQAGAVKEGSGARTGCRWHALHDFMPPRTPRLNVTGTCIMPTPGYKLVLTRAEPQGINPEILILDLQVTPPEGMVIQVLTPAEVHYREETWERYSQVEIRPDGVLIDVETAS